jgi:hypothetical protein
MKEQVAESKLGQSFVEVLQTRYLMKIQCDETRLTLHRHAVTHETIYYIIPTREQLKNEAEQSKQPRVIIQRGETRLVLTWDPYVPVFGETLLWGEIPVALEQIRFRMRLRWDQTQLEIKQLAWPF